MRIERTHGTVATASGVCAALAIVIAWTLGGGDSDASRKAPAGGVPSSSVSVSSAAPAANPAAVTSSKTTHAQARSAAPPKQQGAAVTTESPVETSTPTVEPPNTLPTLPARRGNPSVSTSSWVYPDPPSDPSESQSP